MSTRTLSSWLGTLMLVSIILIVFGLDWPAALWGDFREPPAPPADTTFHWERVSPGAADPSPVGPQLVPQAPGGDALAR